MKTVISKLKWFRQHTALTPIGLGMLGVAVSLVGDLIWLIWECLIETNKFANHPIIYGTIFSLLLWGIILGWFGLKKYMECGLESHERKLMLAHKKEKRRCADLDKCGKRFLTRKDV